MLPSVITVYYTGTHTYISQYTHMHIRMYTHTIQCLKQWSDIGHFPTKIDGLGQTKCPTVFTHSFKVESSIRSYLDMLISAKFNFRMLLSQTNT